jgi:hypothetical protein
MCPERSFAALRMTRSRLPAYPLTRLPAYPLTRLLPELALHSLSRHHVSLRIEQDPNHVSACPPLNEIRQDRVAPAAISPRSLSKSNSASSPTARLAVEVTVPPAARTRARKSPLRGLRLLPSTEILERPGLRSQRTRMVAARVEMVLDAVSVVSFEPDDAFEGSSASLLQAARPPIRPARRGHPE